MSDHLPLLTVFTLITLLIFLRTRPSRSSVAFFHPHADCSGGGERVLWVAISTHLKRTKSRVILYSFADNKTALLRSVSDNFNIEIQSHRLILVTLQLPKSIISPYLPFTLVLQSLGSVALCMEAFIRNPAATVMDTAGYAFTYPVMRLMGATKVRSYTHYPFIPPEIANPRSTSLLRRIYHFVLLRLYAACLRTAKVSVNGSWTRSRISRIIGEERVQIIYPPCSVPLYEPGTKSRVVMSLAQFRPEKDHMKQLEAFKQFRSLEGADRNMQFHMLGSCRPAVAGDMTIVQGLRDVIRKASLEDLVKIHVNLSWEEVQTALSEAMFALHTMRDEHFGISVVEFMGHGVIPIVHASGGPQDDIATSYQGKATGLTASSASEYAQHLLELSNMSDTERLAMSNRCRASVKEKFTDEIFADRWADFCKLPKSDMARDNVEKRENSL